MITLPSFPNRMYCRAVGGVLGNVCSNCKDGCDPDSPTPPVGGSCPLDCSGDGGGGRGYDDDDNECPFSYNVFVGADGTFEVQAASACRFRHSSCIPAFMWAFTVPPITSMNQQFSGECF